MTWAYLVHDDCKLPTLAECKKVRAKTGSIWKCGDSASGCGRTWVLLLEEKRWVETSPKIETYVPQNRSAPLEGAEQPQTQQKRRTLSQGEIEDAKYQLQLKIAASMALELHKMGEEQEQTMVRRERMLDL